MTRPIFNLKKLLVLLPLCMILLLVVLHPDLYGGAVFSGAELYVKSVFPTMLPMLIFSGLFIKTGIADDISIIMKRPMKKLFKAPPVAGYIAIISMLSGYPIGAKMVSDYYVSSIIDDEDASRIATFSSTSGPMFIIGTVGSGFFNNARIGYILLIAHYLSALFTGLIMCCPKRKSAYLENRKPYLDSSSGNPIGEVFSNSMSTVLLVGGFVAIFYMLTEILFVSGILDSLESVGGTLLKGIAVSVVEMTRGTQILSSYYDKKIAVAVAAAMISFGGLSVTMQSMAFYKTAHIRASRYLISKLLQGTIAFGAAYLLIAVFI